MNYEPLIADLVARIPDLAIDMPVNREMVIRGLLWQHLGKTEHVQANWDSDEGKWTYANTTTT